MALQDHAQGIADQQHFHAGLAGSLGKRGIVGGQHGDLLAFLLEPQQGAYGYLWHENILISARFLHRRGATGRL
ncbi:hypothetical protein D3C78_1718570 [compost metagenome]